MKQTAAAREPSALGRTEKQADKSEAGPDLLISPDIEMVEVTTLRYGRRSARTHPKRKLSELAGAIKRFRSMTPIVVDARNEIVAGFARFHSAKILGLKRVPCIRASHLSEPEIRAYMLADNKLSEKAGWDLEILAPELAELQVVLPEIGLDLEITGFEPGEVDTILLAQAEAPPGADSEIPDLEQSTRAQLGHLFVLGAHRLLVGDARNGASYDILMQGQVAEMGFLDPPYNVPVIGHIGGRGKVKHKEFVCASGEMDSEQFTAFLQHSLGHCAAHTVDGGITYICMDWRHVSELLKAGRVVYDELKNVCVWAKTTPGQGSFYRSQHELVFVYKRGQSPHLNTFQLGQHGRTRSNVWTYPGANCFRAGRMDDLKMHPTVKPVALIADAMRDCSRRGSIILDAFCGSGTTIVAAEQIARRAFCLEIDPKYADVAIKRWQQLTKRDAILESTGQTFDELPPTV